MHADQAHAERLRVRDAANRHHRVRARDIRLLHQREQILARVRRGDAAAVVNDRTLGRGEYFGYLPQLRFRDFRLLHLYGGGCGHIFAYGGRYILRYIDKDGAGPVRIGDAERFAQRIGQLFHITHDEVVLGNRHRDAGYVYFLKAVPADQTGADVAGDRDHGDGIHISRGNAGIKVGCARAGGRDANAGLAGGARVAVRRVGRTLFMCGQNMSNPVCV